MGAPSEAKIDPPDVEGWRSSRTDGGVERPSDWGSLVADLSVGSTATSWHIHDRTHLEFAVQYAAEGRAPAYEWEAFFFVPESLRLDSTSYTKEHIYSDLQSYVRFAAPAVGLSDIPDVALEQLRAVIERGVPALIVRELRLFACQVRAAGVAARGAISDALGQPARARLSMMPDTSVEEPAGDRRTRGLAATARMVNDVRRITSGLREVLAGLPTDDTLQTAAKWIDEDISRLVETLMGSLAVRLKKAGAPETLRASVVAAAVAEARYRTDHDLDGVGRVGASKREIEHLEFRRHVLKRFTSSVLWLSPEVRDGARYVLQVLYALAAGVAMAFAVTAALLNGDPTRSDQLWIWVAIAVLAYMGKDRIKASLQGIFSKVVSRHLPDRRWRIRDRERGAVVGKVDEQSGFVSFADLPAPVLEKRRSTRRHPLEEQARPETVLHHRKIVRLDPTELARADERFGALTEIFRLDLRRWLAHTDDPKRKIVFADAEEERICSAVAPRVYNLGIVYRLRKLGDEDSEWHRLRVVVSRKGIRRIDAI